MEESVAPAEVSACPIVRNENVPTDQIYGAYSYGLFIIRPRNGQHYVPHATFVSVIMPFFNALGEMAQRDKDVLGEDQFPPRCQKNPWSLQFVLLDCYLWF